jgi:hypothetical protein
MLGARIRSIFRAEPADVVEEVAWARAAIWGRRETPDEVLGREYLSSLLVFICFSLDGERPAE